MCGVLVKVQRGIFSSHQQSKVPPPPLYVSPFRDVDARQYLFHPFSMPGHFDILSYAPLLRRSKGRSLSPSLCLSGCVSRARDVGLGEEVAKERRRREKEERTIVTAVCVSHARHCIHPRVLVVATPIHPKSHFTWHSEPLVSAKAYIMLQTMAMGVIFGNFVGRGQRCRYTHKNHQEVVCTY